MEQNFDLSRFISAHQRSYSTALKEIKNGKKSTCWMWYIFPQMIGLGRSSTADIYAINSLEEARAFLNDEYLGKNLLEICGALLQLDTNNAVEVFGHTDAVKLKSSMTLFACASDSDTSVFNDVLNKYFDGKPDYRTKSILGL